MNIESGWWRLPNVLKFTSIGRSTWLKMVKTGRAPKPIKLPGQRTVIWNAEEVKAWLESISDQQKEVA
jgi:predicted DNA-binding transcriptional regulator AlpA